jgi:putative toxin-antitoxin system antitoxin component (TIGR02293 family)
MDTQVAELLGGEGVLGTSVKSNLDLARATREGLPTEAAIQLATLILDCVPEGPLGPLMPYKPSTGEFRDLVNGLIGLPRRLTLEQSDVVVRIAGAVARAIDVLGDRKKAVRWLTASNRALGGEIPITLLDTSAGAHEVETVLDRIEYGVYS